MTAIQTIQDRLKRKGFYKGAIDNEFGPLSLAALFAEKGDDVPIWMRIAAKELGVRERKNGENPRIIEYHSTTSLDATEDEVPWCSSFANWVFFKSQLPRTNSAAAISWLAYGSVSKPRFGAIAVYSRTGGNHVAFLLERTAAGDLVLGGNQSDAVTVTMHGINSLKGYRWPA